MQRGSVGGMASTLVTLLAVLLVVGLAVLGVVTALLMVRASRLERRARADDDVPDEVEGQRGRVEPDG